MQEETAFALYTEALCECDRQSVPKLGIATDRRALNYVGEVFRVGYISTLICFICNCNHICHGGYDKFGTECGKGAICFRPHNEEEAKLLADMFNNDVFWEFNLSSKRPNVSEIDLGMQLLLIRTCSRAIQNDVLVLFVRTVLWRLSAALTM